MDTPTRDSGWHLDRRVPIAIIAALLIQTAGIVWWAASLSARVDYIQRDVDGRRNQQSEIASLNARMQSIERILARIERILDDREPQQGR